MATDASGPNESIESLVDETEVRRSLDASVLSILPICTLGAGIILLLNSIGRLFVLDVTFPRGWISGSSSLLMFVAWWSLMRYRPAERWAHPIALVLVSVILLNCGLNLWLDPGPFQAMYFVIMLLVVGFIFLATTWFGAALVLTLLTWELATRMLPEGFDWSSERLGLLSAAGVAVIIHLGRVRVVRGLARLRAIDQKHREQLAEALVVAKAELEERHRVEHEMRESDRRREAFLAALAHELRDPLAAIVSANDIATQSGMESDRDWAGQVIRRQSDRIGRLVDDLMEVSRTAQGKLRFEKQVFALDRWLQGILDPFRSQAERFGLRLEWEAPTTPLGVEADPNRLEQILGNLLSNAIKYTDPGGTIWVSARREGGDAVIEIQDTGIGIAQEDLPRIFDMFTQGENAQGRTRGGIGIGLTLARLLTDLHGGSLTATSAGPGQGSRFTVRLPVVAPPAVEPCLDAPTVPSALVGPRRRLLIIDDNVPMTDALARLLRLADHEVETASNGTDGLEAARRFRPEVVFLDIGLPDLDGEEVLQRLRAQPESASAVCVAITGFGQEGDRRRFRATGFDDFLIKPIETETALRLLRDLDLPEPAGPR